MRTNGNTDLTCRACGATFRGWINRPRPYCSAACYHRWREAHREARFWSHVDKAGPPPAHRPDLGGCWLWTGALCGKGYGACGYGMRHVMTHRLAWELTNGPIPDGLDVLHKCDVMRCVRPDHLYVGTQSDNNHDMWNRERRTHSRKLTAADVLTIRRECAAGEDRQMLANTYGVHYMTIADIVWRRTWKHLPDPLSD